MKNASALDRPKESNAEETAIEKKERETMRTIEEQISDCRAKLYDPLISEVTRNLYEAMFVEIREKKEKKWAEDSTRDLDNIIRNAETYRDMFEERLSTAVSKNWISEASGQRWRDRFNNPNLLEYTRRKFVEDKFPVFVDNWERNAIHRKKLLVKFKEHDHENEPAIDILQDENAFLSLDYHKQKNLLATLEALDTSSIKGEKKIFAETRAILTKAASGKGKYIHPVKTGAFLKQMMIEQKPDEFRSKILLPSLEQYRGTRIAFDAFETDARSTDDASLKIPKLDTFLRWDVEKRAAYIEEGRRRMEEARIAVSSEEKEQSVCKKQIEKTMDMGDWQGAALLLAEAAKTYPDDKGLSIMERYLNKHRTDLQEKEQEETIVDTKMDIQAMLSEYPHSARGIYAVAVNGGSDTFSVVMESVYRGAQETHTKPASGRTTTIPRDTKNEKLDAYEAKEDEAGEEEIVLKDDSDDDTAEALEALTSESLFDSPEEKTLTVANVTAEKQMLYHTQLSLPILRKLRYLESMGERYEMAA